MKQLIIIFSVILSGCSTLGNIEGTGEVGEVFRSLDKTRAVITGRSSSRSTSSKINRVVGHTKALQDKNDPVIVLRDILDIYRYMP